MTVLSQTSKMAPQAMNGVAVTFSFTFRALTDFPAAIKAVVTDTTTGTDTDLIYNDAGTDGYSVSIDSDGVGGSITVNDARSSDYTITIYREYDETQESNYADYNSFPAETVEDNYDKLTMIDQQQTEVLGRTLTLPITVTGVSVELPTPEASQLLGWNATADAIINYAYPTGGTATLQTAFDAGQSITISDGDNQTLLITNNDVTNDPIPLSIVDAATAASVQINNTGNGAHLRFLGDPTVASPVDGDLWYTGAALNFYNGTSTTDLLSSGVSTLQGAFDGGQTITIADTDNQTLAITNNDTTNDPVTMTITNAGSGHALSISQTGDLNASNYGLNVTTNVNQTNASLVNIQTDTAQTGVPLVRMYMNNASASQPTLTTIGRGTASVHFCWKAAGDAECLDLLNDGGGAHIRFRGDPNNTTPNDGDMWYDGVTLYFRDSGTTRTINWT